MTVFLFRKSTEFKIKNGMSQQLSVRTTLTPALNSEPLGPYNKELQDLATLSTDTKSLAVITTVLRKKLAKVLAQASKPRNLRSTDRTAATAPPLLLDMLAEITVLKCLTVVLHLCQRGAPQFLQWIRREYQTLIVPLGRLAYNAKYSHVIYLKVSLVVRFCESDAELVTSRRSMDEVRLELRPGVVRAKSPVGTLATPMVR